MSLTRTAWAIAPALLILSNLPVFAANLDTAQFVVNFAADTKDFHITVGGKVTSVKFTLGGNEIKPNNSNGGGTGQYNAGWTNPPGAGAVTVDLGGHEGGNQWNGKYWLTTDGGLVRPNVGNTGVFASISPDFGDDTLTLFGDNGFDLSPLNISSFEVTEVSDFSLLDTPAWLTATGPTFSFNATTLGAGATGVDLGTIPWDGSSWVRITALVDGSQQILAYSASQVPEPAAPILLGGGLVVLGLLRRGRARRENRSLAVAAR